MISGVYRVTSGTTEAFGENSAEHFLNSLDRLAQHVQMPGAVPSF
jgi:hypothetical protein